MKRFIVLVLIVNALLLGVRAWQELPVAQGGVGLPATDDRFCADPNGDGVVDMADALTILNFLFTGQGSPPYCITEGTSIDELTAQIVQLDAALVASQATLGDCQSQLDACCPEVDESILFHESFDEPELPCSLTYISNGWDVDGSGQLSTATTAGAYSEPLSSLGLSVLPEGAGLLYSADMGKPVEASTSDAVVLIVGTYWVIFHPGALAPPGAFRLEVRDLNGALVERIVGNQDMGFSPIQGQLHHVEALVTLQGGELSLEIAITGMGTDCNKTYTYSYIDPEPDLGEGRIGVQSGGSGFFDNIDLRLVNLP